MDENSKKSKLLDIYNNIRESWVRDIDKIKYYIELNDIIKDILKKESIEEYFNNNEEDIKYFIEEFLKEVLDIILKSFKIYGNDGDEIGLDLLFNVYHIFTKFHKNEKYSPIYELIRTVFKNDESNHNFFDGNSNHVDNEVKKYDYSKFNLKYNSEFKNQESKKFEVNDIIDIPIEYEKNRTIDKYCWVRGKITEITDDEYIVNYWKDKEKRISKSDVNIYPAGTKTTDWEWRTNLKKWDLVDCYDRSKWYPATIMDIKEEGEIEGIKFFNYQIGWRLYPEHYNNLEDPEDKPEKHLDLWTTNKDIETDSKGEKFFGDRENFDEKIPYFSKRIQKFDTFSKLQLKYLNYNFMDPSAMYGYHSFSSDTDKSNPLKIMSDNLYNDTELIMDQFYKYEKDGKKNIILGKTKKFSCYFALLLKKIEEENGFEKLMEILQDKPNAEEIYTIFFILYHSFNYIHIDYFKEKMPILKKVILEFINDLDAKKMKTMPKDFRSVVIDLLEKISKNENADFFYEVTLSLSLKEIKTSTFNLRLNGIKDLDEFIEKNKNNKEMRTKLIELIKKNELIQEIFGANYHSQIINKSKEIVKLLLLENQLNKDDIELIWNCTKKGDLEAKVTILKLLYELADNLKEDYVEMLLNNIKLTDGKKINNDELDLVYKLSLQGEHNEKNILICTEYLCNCLLASPTPHIKNNPILDKVLTLAQKNDIYLKKILTICENCLKKNENSLLSYSILFEIMDKMNIEENECIQGMVKDQYLLHLFEDNFRLYNKQASELFEKSEIKFEDGANRDKFKINGFTHYENISYRIDILGNMIKYLYKDYDFIPFLKEILITKALSPNDKLIFYQFIKQFLSNDNAAEENNVNEELNKKIKQNLFELISENKEEEITLDELGLFVSLFLEMNSDKIWFEEKDSDNGINNANNNNMLKQFNIKIISLDKIEDLKGLDKFWDLTLKIKSEDILVYAINILFKLYSTKFLPELLEKCTKLILEENSNPQIFQKCIKFLKLIIIESEKDSFIRPKSHLSLLKHCLINLPIDIRTHITNKNINKIILTGNTTMNDLKIITGKLYEIIPNNIKISLNKDYLERVQKLDSNSEIKKLLEKAGSETDLDENFNNVTLYQILDLNEKKINDIKPSDKLSFGKNKKKKTEKLIIDDELNPKLEKILKNWFNDFTKGEDKMDRKGIANFIQGVSSSKEEVDEDDEKVTRFLKENDRNEKGYVSEEEFLEFYKRAGRVSDRQKTIWSNLRNMKIREDLKKEGEPYDIDYVENDKLPRYKLGNNIEFMKNLIKQYYKDVDNNHILIEFLNFLTTNETLYEQVLDMFNETETEKEKKVINTILNDDNKYVELNYVFIIIQSILQDLEMKYYLNALYNLDENYIDDNDKNYELYEEKYEPFDNKNNNDKKIKFFKNLVNHDNFNKIIKNINSLLIKIEANLGKNNKICDILLECCSRGLYIVNVINNLSKGNPEEELKKDLNDNYIYEFGKYDLSLILKDIDYKAELDKISFVDLINNLLNYLNSKNNKDNMNIKFNRASLNLVIDLLSSKKDLFLEYLSNEDNKNKLMNLFKKNISNKDKEYSLNFLIDINNSSLKALRSKNYNYIKFLYKLSNSLLNNLISVKSDINNEEKTGEEIFTPNDEFFELYNLLNKLMEDIKKLEGDDNAINTSETEENESFANKVYNLLMKELNEVQNINETNEKNKNILNLLKLFDVSVKSDSNKKAEILFNKNKSYRDMSLFDLILQKYISILKKQIQPEKSEKSEKKISQLMQDEEIKKIDQLVPDEEIKKIDQLVPDTPKKKIDQLVPVESRKKIDQLISKSSESESKANDSISTDNNKFILLDDIKEEKKEEDNSSTEELYKLYGELVIEGFKNPKCQFQIRTILEIINILKQCSKKEKNGNDSDSDDRDNTPQSMYNHHYSSRKQCGHVGLKNLGCICYLNSVMQQIYMVPTFRRAVMWSDDGKPPNPSSNYRYSCDDDNLLHQLQEMYTYLTFSEKMDYNPKGFCFSFKDMDGHSINIGAQQDSQEFLNSFCDKIENSLKITKFKHIVNDVFTGRTCSSVVCDECKHVSNRIEDFYTLTLEVKNINTLNDSLHKLIVPEIIDDFKCSNCNKNVTIRKITSINKLPNVLIIHLKRFYLDYETCHTTKINSRMEFPHKINLKDFCVEEITKNYSLSKDAEDDIYLKEDSYYQYDLKGINVHTGSADGGHYFSYIDVERDGIDNLMNEDKKNWLTFNDSHVSTFDVDKIPSECFGGNTEGYSFENCQNAYLLIYERKKKSPIRILLEENEVKKLDLNDEKIKSNIIEINKENRNHISKEYDMSRINNNIDEKILYEKIFFDSEKNEYYKYIPYYSLPKYAPRKIYLEVMNDNNKSPSAKTNNKKNKLLLKRYKNILMKKSKEVDFRATNQEYDNDGKLDILTVVLNNFIEENLKSVNSLDDDDKKKINEEFSNIMEKLLLPVVDKNMNLNIIKLLVKTIFDEDNCQKIFCNSMGYYSKDNPILNYENSEKFFKIFEDITSILYDKLSNDNYKEEIQKIIKTLLTIVKNAKSKKNSLISNSERDNERDNDNQEGIIFAYKLMYKICKEKEHILKALLNNDLIDILFKKLSEHIKPICEVIYDTLLFIIKQTDDYNNSNFDLNPDEKEGEYSADIRVYLNNEDNQKIFDERPEIIKLLLVIMNKDNGHSSIRTKEFIDYIFSKYSKNQEKIYDLLDIISSLIQINDNYTYERLIKLAGYPSLVVLPIEKEDSDNSDDEIDENDDTKKNIKQKWPLFGERLIKGNINKEIYEYVLSNRKKSYRSLFAILFPSEYILVQNKENTIRISDEKKKKILISMIKSIFGERNNYPLFKYLYLTPARSLLYKNLYEEIIAFIDIDNIKDLPFTVENMKDKEKKYKIFVEKEVNKVLEETAKKDKEESDEYSSYRYHGYSDEDVDLDDLYESEAFFKCKDKNMKLFTGFIPDIIPGKVIREEINGIAKSSKVCMYRIHYYTKYFKLDEFRQKLLNNEIISDDSDEELDKDNKSVSRKSSSRSVSRKSSSRSNSSKKSKSNDEDKDSDKPKDDSDKEEKSKDDEDKEKNEEEKNAEENKEDNDKEEENKKDKDDEENNYLEKEEKKDNKEEEEKKEDKENEEDKKDESNEKNKEDNKEENGEKDETKDEKNEQQEEEKKGEENIEEEKKEDENKEEEHKEDENKEEKKEEDKEDDNKEEKKEEKSDDEKKEEKPDDEEKDDEEKKEEKSDEEEEKNNKEKNSDEEDKRSSNNSRKNSASSKKSDNDSNKEKEKEEKKEEPIDSEIKDDIYDEDDVIKYDVSERNENSIIYKVYSNKSVFILEDKKVKNRNHIKNTLNRFIFCNRNKSRKDFIAVVKKQRYLKKLTKKNLHLVNEIKDYIAPKNYTCFWNIQRLRGELDFPKKDDIAININFEMDSD